MRMTLAIFLNLLAFCFAAKTQTIASASDTVPEGVEYLPHLRLERPQDSVAITPWMSYNAGHVTRRLNFLAYDRSGGHYNYFTDDRYGVIIMPGTPASIGYKMIYWWYYIYEKELEPTWSIVKQLFTVERR